MPPYYLAFYKIIDFFEKKVLKEKFEGSLDDEKRQFKINWWKAQFIGVPGNVFACYVIPLLAQAVPVMPAELTFPVLMGVSFTYFILRTSATGK